jgi:hypothetical protein
VDPREAAELMRRNDSAWMQYKMIQGLQLRR